MFPYDYPSIPHVRKHAPRGYTDYTSFKPWLRDEFLFRCAYCLHRERFEKDGSHYFHIDHFRPKSAAENSGEEYENLYYVCARCNAWKGNQILPFEPCKDALGAHIQFDRSGKAIALNEIGESFIAILRLNESIAVEFRNRMISIYLSSLNRVAWNNFLFRWFRIQLPSPKAQVWFGYPDDLPDLSALKPPGGNDRPAGILESFFFRSRSNNLSDFY